ncbi:MAG: hypothetical protein LBU69_00705, partial [Deltaproteobacteria bacterium]|nr:hypothetical protein [Deltaproteobacteria bacterium]
ISWEKLSGPAPGRLSLDKAIAYDQQGRFASIDRLELSLRTSSLLSGLIDIESLKASGLSLERRPEIVPKQDKDKPSGGTLPFGIKANVELTGTVANKFLAPGTQGQGSGNLALGGNFSLIDGALRAELNSSWLDGRSQGLNLKAEVSQGLDGLPDTMKLLVSAQDCTGGPLSYLLGRPDWPAWSLVVSGEGPLSDWHGLATLGLDKDPLDKASMGNGLARDGQKASGATDAGGLEQGSEPTALAMPKNLANIATARLTVQGKTGRVRDDFVRDLAATISVSAQAGPEAPLPIPEGIRNILGQAIELEGKAELNGKSVKGELFVLAPRASVKVAGLEIKMANGGFELAGHGQLGFSQTLTDLLAASLGPQSGQDGRQAEPKVAPLPNAQVTGKVAFTGPTVPEGDQLSPESAPDSPDPAYPALPPRPFSRATQLAAEDSQPSQAPGGWVGLDYGLALASKDGEISLGDLRLSAPGLMISGSGKMAPNSGREAKLTLGLEPDSLFWPIVLGLLEKENQEGTALGLKASLAQDQEGAFDLSAELSLKELGILASPWAGPIEASLTAKGPAERLAVGLTAKSEALKGPLEVFPDVTLDFNGELSGLPKPALAKGQLAIKTGDFSAGPLELATGLSFSLASPGAAASLPNQASAGEANNGLAPTGTNNQGLAMDLALSGLSLSAGPNKEFLALESPSLGISLRPGSPPAFEGSLRLNVGNWKIARALTGLELNGAPASLEADLGPAGGSTHSAVVKLVVPELRLGQDLALNSLTLDLTARNYLTDLNFDLSLSAGQSKLGPVSLSKAQVRGQGQGQKAGLDVELLAANGSEFLTLSGDADLASRKANIVNLQLAPMPWVPGGLRLSQPMALDFASGLSIGKAAISLGKGGTLEVSGSLDPLSVKARLADFSMANLSGLSGSVPQGLANLTLDYGQGGTGSFELAAKLAAPAALEGLSKTLNVTANGRFEGPRTVSGKITLNQSRFKDVSLNYRLPLAPAGKFFKPDMDGPISAELTWKGSVAPIWNLIGLADRTLTGELDLALKVEGSINKPRPKANLYLANGQYEDLVLGLLVSRINMEAHDQEDGNI